MVTPINRQVRASMASASSTASSTLGLAHHHFRRHIRGRTEIEMVPGALDVDGLELRYAVSSNRSEGQQWAINIHGYLAGASMYSRESERLAEAFGWRVVNPSLPGFGGSEPLPWDQISMESLVRRIDALVEHFGLQEVILIGHSMGAGVAMQYAAEHPERVAGILYRDGVATPAWQKRHGMIPLAVSTIAPDLAPLADLVGAVALDLPDLFLGRALTTLRSLVPDFRRNMKVLAQTAPLASMLMAVDQRSCITAVRKAGIPVLAVWGCFDRVTTKESAEEFSSVSGVPVQWVPGGHSWMLARPTGQVDVLRYMPLGKTFLSEVEDRAAALKEGRPRLRSVS